MRVLCISGSQKKNGNTTRLINNLAEKIVSSDIPDLKIKFLSLSGLKVRPCRACEKCKKTGACVIKDDFSTISRKLLKSDLIIFGSPVYFHDVSGTTKNLIDRSFSLWHDKQLRGKRIIPVAVCAESGDERTLETIRIWAQAQEMRIVRSLSGHGYKPGDITNDPDIESGVSEVVRDIIGNGKNDG